MVTVTEPKPQPKPKRVRVSQANFPQLPIMKSLGIIQILWDQYGGNPTLPDDVAFAMKLIPTSGYWRNLAGTSIAYGLTEGGSNAKVITLASLGKRIVAPTKVGDDMLALRDAVMKPNIMHAFYEKYNHRNFPDTNIAENILVGLQLPKERASDAVEILIANGLATGILRQTPTGYYVAIDASLPASRVGESEEKPSFQEEPPRKEYETPPGNKEKITFGKGLYINFEIHIDADTPIDTIVAIFQNMKTYLLDNE